MRDTRRPRAIDHHTDGGVGVRQKLDLTVVAGHEHGSPDDSRFGNHRLVGPDAVLPPPIEKQSIG